MAGRNIFGAMMVHEPNTFSPVPTPLASFRPLAGEAAVAEFRDTNTQLGGVLHVARGLRAGGSAPPGGRRAAPPAGRRGGAGAGGRRGGRAAAPHPRRGAAPPDRRRARL